MDFPAIMIQLNPAPVTQTIVWGALGELLGYGIFKKEHEGFASYSPWVSTSSGQEYGGTIMETKNIGRTLNVEISENHDKGFLVLRKIVAN